MKPLHIALLLLTAIVLVACSGTVVKHGDYVLVTYAGRYDNGTLFDTNDPSLQAQFPAPASHFVSLPVQIGANQVVPGFENALLGMHKGETKTVVIKAHDAYGGYDPSKTVNVPKQMVFPLLATFVRTVSVPISQLPPETQANLTTGMNITTQNFVYTVTGFNATDATLYLDKPLSDPISIQGLPWNSTLASENATDITYRSLVQANQTYGSTLGSYTSALNATDVILTTDLQVGGSYQTKYGIGRAVKETPNAIVIDFNSPLAGYDLNFTIRVDDIQETK